MEMIKNINSKLDIGWKLTNLSCYVCKGTTLAEPRKQNTEYYCPKCNKIYPLNDPQWQNQDPDYEEKQFVVDNQQEQEEPIAKPVKIGTTESPSTTNYQTKVEPFKAESIPADRRQSQASKTNQVSKQIGQKLMKGWTMLNENCMDCFVPLMRSKKGQKICCGCHKDFSEQKNTQKKTNVDAKIKESLQKKEVVKSQVTAQVKGQVKPKGSGSTSIFDRIQQNSLSFLEAKLNRSIQENDLSRFEQILSLIYKIKNEFR